MRGAEEATVEVNGVGLWTKRQGSGPPLVLLHGGPGLWDGFDVPAAMIDDLVAVHRYDQRGCGRSERVPPYDLATFVADLDALRAHWGHERWIVGGHSAGASLALAYAATHAERVRGLVLISGTGLLDDWRDEYRARREALTSDAQRARRAELDRLRASNLDAWTSEVEQEYCLLSWQTDFADRARADDLTRGLLRPFRINFEVNQRLGADWKQAVQAGEVARSVASLHIPALVLHGSDDPRPVRLAEHLATTLPQGRVAVVHQCGHFPWLEQPELTRAMLRAFLAGFSETSAPDSATQTA